MTLPGVQEYLLDVISAEHPRRGRLANGLRLTLSALSHTYDLGLEVYLAAERIGLRRREKLPVPVVSIGNLTVGGTGKTPMAQLVCRELSAQGHLVALLSRGHGGKNAPVLVVSDGAGQILTNPDEAGDEPVLLAQTLLGVPVIVGKDRRLTGREALRRHRLDAIVLDDGLQYWQLARDLDIVLVDARNPFDNGRTLPRGLLRESARHIRRAGIVVVTRSESLDRVGRAEMRETIGRLAPKAVVYFAQHKAIGFIRIDGGRRETIYTDELRDVPVLALSGIARPQAFLDSLTEASGCRIADRIDRADHQTISLQDATGVLARAKKAGAKAIVMTEKDGVKWSVLNPKSPLPVYVLTIAIQIDNQAEFIGQVVARLFGKEKK